VPPSRQPPDPDPEPAGSDYLPLPSDIEFPEIELPKLATPAVPFPAPAEVAPAPLPPAAHAEPPNHPALSFSFVAVLLAAAGIGLTFDRAALDQMSGDASDAIAAFLKPNSAENALGGSAAQSSAETAEALVENRVNLTPFAFDTAPVIAQTQAPLPVEVSRAATASSSLIAQNWSTPLRRDRVAMPPLTGRVDLVPLTPFETASNQAIGPLTAVQDAIGLLDESNAPAIAETALPVPVTPVPAATLTLPEAMADPDPTSGAPLSEVELASLAPADPALELGSLVQPAALEPPVLLDAELDALTTPRSSAVPRPQARPVLLAASRTPLARPQVDLTIPPAQLVTLTEGQSGKTAERPLFVHIPSREEASVFDDVLAAVRSKVTPHVETRPVNFKISTPQIRYYHEEDRDSAAAIAQALGVWLHDLTSFRPVPKRGLIEVWVQGTNVSPVAAPPPRRQVRQPRRTRQPVSQPTPAPIEPDLPAAALEPGAISSAVDAALQAATTQDGVRVRRVQVAPEASRSPVRRLLNAWGSQDVTTIEQFSAENAD